MTDYFEIAQELARTEIGPHAPRSPEVKALDDFAAKFEQQLAKLEAAAAPKPPKATPNPWTCYTPERCAGRTSCPHNPACTE